MLGKHTQLSHYHLGLVIFRQTGNENLKGINCQVLIKFWQKLIQARSKTLCSDTHKLIHYTHI